MPSTVTSSPGATSRTYVAPITSRAGDSEATAHPSGASTPPNRPRQRGRNPWGSRTAWTRPASTSTRLNAPSTCGRTAPIASESVHPSPISRASSSATTSVSVSSIPGSIPARSASAGVLVRFPLCASANPSAPWERKTGWAACHADSPWVEYRVCPMIWSPSRAASERSLKTEATRPMSFTTVTVSRLALAIPADSWPRCWSAYSASKTRCETSRPGAETATTPQASLTARSAGPSWPTLRACTSILA